MTRPRSGTLALIFVFCLAIAATFFFGYRAGRTARHMHWRNEGIEPWMSVPFVAHTHHMRPEALFQAIHAQPNPRYHRPIREIAREEHVPVRDLIHDLELAIKSANSAVPQSGKEPGKAP
jgi:hypothetical protein